MELHKIENVLFCYLILDGIHFNTLIFHIMNLIWLLIAPIHIIFFIHILEHIIYEQ